MHDCIKLKCVKMFLLISIIVGMTLNGQERYDINLINMDNYELLIGFGYESANIETVRCKINSPTHDARHSINTNQGYDINTSSKLALIPEGEKSSIRLGNSNNGSQSEKICYTLRVDSDNNSGTVNYKYALVFHTTAANIDLEIQPKFEIKIYVNDLLVEIPLEVTPYSKHIDFNTEKYSDQRIIRWSNWASDQFDLSQFDIDDEITLEFESYDCAVGRSFGYGYLVIE